MTAINKTEIVSVRIECKLKHDAETILKRLGVSHSTLINMSYRAVIEEKGIPHSFYVPNNETARVLREARQAKKRNAYSKAETLDAFKTAFCTPHNR